MNDLVLATDTHPLLWYLSKSDRKLPKKVFSAFESAREGTGCYIWLPAAAAWEISCLLRKTDRIKLQVSFDELLRENFYLKGLALAQVEMEDLAIAHALGFNSDPFDALIVASAKRLQVPLITADALITDSAACEMFW